MKHVRRSASIAALIGAVALALGLNVGPDSALSPVSLAHAQGPIRNLIARLRGATLPAGIVKSNGRIEATQVDVSSKYARPPRRGHRRGGLERRPGAGHREDFVARIRGSAARRRGERAELEGRPHRRRSGDRLAPERARLRQVRLRARQELMKTGFITKQVFEQRKRNLDSAVAGVASFTSQRDQAQSKIKNSEAEVERIESIIHDLTLVSPRNGRVQYRSPAPAKSSPPARRSSPFSISPTST